MQIKNWEFESIFRNLKIGGTNQKVSFMLVNDDGMILLDPDRKLDGQDFRGFTTKDITFKPGFQSFKTQFGGEKAFCRSTISRNIPGVWSLSLPGTRCLMR